MHTSPSDSQLTADDPSEAAVGEGVEEEGEEEEYEDAEAGAEGGGEAEEVTGSCLEVSSSRAILGLDATNWLMSLANLTDQEPFFSTNPILSGAKLCFLKSSIIRLATSFVATMTWHPFSEAVAFSIRNSSVTNLAISSSLCGSSFIISWTFATSASALSANTPCGPTG